MEENTVLTTITLVCQDCGKEFIFTVGEQEFYKEKGISNSVHCAKSLFFSSCGDDFRM